MSASGRQVRLVSLDGWQEQAKGRANAHQMAFLLLLGAFSSSSYPWLGLVVAPVIFVGDYLLSCLGWLQATGRGSHRHRGFLSYREWAAIAAGRKAGMLVPIAQALVAFGVLWVWRGSPWPWLVIVAMLLLDYVEACRRARRLPPPPDAVGD